jgi:hypothetical protein
VWGSFALLCKFSEDSCGQTAARRASPQMLKMHGGNFGHLNKISEDSCVGVAVDAQNSVGGVLSIYGRLATIRALRLTSFAQDIRLAFSSDST